MTIWETQHSRACDTLGDICFHCSNIDGIFPPGLTVSTLIKVSTQDGARLATRSDFDTIHVSTHTAACRGACYVSLSRRHPSRLMPAS